MDDIDGLTREEQLDMLTAPLFDMLTELEERFAEHALDTIGLSDDVAEECARTWEAHDERHGEKSGVGRAFAYLLRQVTTHRMLRGVCVAMETQHAKGGPDLIRVDELMTEHAKIQTGES